jgi:hypothetical protein
MEVFEGKDISFKAFSTYLEANFFHEEMPYGIVDMIKPSKKRNFAYEDDIWHYGPILFTQRVKGATGLLGRSLGA